MQRKFAPALVHRCWWISATASDGPGLPAERTAPVAGSQ